MGTVVCRLFMALLLALNAVASSIHACPCEAPARTAPACCEDADTPAGTPACPCCASTRPPARDPGAPSPTRPSLSKPVPAPLTTGVFDAPPARRSSIRADHAAPGRIGPGRSWQAFACVRQT
jgi:hypothetical protein